MGLAELDAALVAVREGALAATAGVNLRLDDHFAVRHLRRGVFQLPSLVRGRAPKDGDAVLREKVLGLIFVNIHEFHAGGIPATSITIGSI